MDFKTETQLRRALADTLEMLRLTNAHYYELLMAVARKHEGETRHQTALRYIREAETVEVWATQPGGLEP